MSVKSPESADGPLPVERRGIGGEHGKSPDSPLPVPRPPIPDWLRPVHLALAVVAIAFIALLALGPVPVVDLWWQMKAGQLIWETGRVPRHDPFSYTSGGAEWIVQEWLPSLLFYLLYTFISPTALVVYKMAGAALAFGLVLWRCVRCTDRWLLSALLTLLAAYAARTFLDIRPQILTYILFAGLLTLLEEYRRQTRTAGNEGKGRAASKTSYAARSTQHAARPFTPFVSPDPAHRLLWFVPLLMLLWANLHAGFMLGFFALGVYLVGEAWDLLRGDRSRRPVVRALAVVIALSVPLTLLQPNGVALWRYPFMLMGHGVVMDFIREWKSPDFHQAWTRPYEALLLVAMGGLALSRRPVWAGDLLFLLLLAHASLTSIRHIPVFAIACTPILAAGLADVLTRLEQRLAAGGRLARSAALATALALVGVAYGLAAELRNTPRSDWFGYTGAMHTFPVAACDAIQARGWEGNLFNDYKWGGYCLWRFYPRRRIFIDGRAEVYFQTAFDDYYAIHNVAPDWNERLRKWRVETALLDRNSHLARVMEASPGWTRVYHDPVAVIYRRTKGEG